jgi:signal transduction histidine kinase
MDKITQQTKLPRRTLRWRDSLYFRVMVLCGVLLVCLLLSVTVISRYYYGEVIREMEAQTQGIADHVALKLEDEPGISLDVLRTELYDEHQGFDIELEPFVGDIGKAEFTVTSHDDGSISRGARVPMLIGDRKIMLTATVTIVPQTEILRAFTNKYMLALIAVFILTLAGMVYVIVKSLGPLADLSETCAEISRGELREANTRGATGEVLALEETFNEMVHALQAKEHVEAKLRQAQRLSALGNLAAGVAHDVRNPLNAIKLLSSHTIDKLDDNQESAVALKPLQTIRKEVERLEEIVSSFLSLARESELKAEPHELEPILEECVALIQKDAEDRGVRLSCELRTSHAKLMLDPKQFKRALLNVLINGLEATPSSGRLRLFSRLTERTCEIEIRDDGPGLSKTQLEQVFDPYYTTKTGGTGLGLSITRGIVEEHGGTIEMSSIETQGCQVLISLPLEKVVHS